MRSLTAHLRDDEQHDRLPFHPSCPICRQTRLSGALDVGGLMPMRTQALLAAGVLAASTTAPVTVAFATEPDQQQDGAAPIAQSETPDSAASPDFDPGGEATDLPDTASPMPETPAPADEGNDDIAPVEQPSATDPADQVVDSGDGSDTAPTQGPAAAEGATPAPTATATPPSTPAGPTVDTTPPAQDTTPVSDPTPTTTTDAPAGAETRPSPAGERRSVEAPSNGGTNRRAQTRSTAPASVGSQAVPAGEAGTAAYRAAPEPSTAAVTSGATPVDGRPARPGDRTHTVFAGESLWAIASDLLGREATPAAVAREVHRLWQLNRDRIATGDPDLLIVGTRLLLR
jgi:hypothetical protein